MKSVAGKKLLILGAGPAQLDLIRYCREQGIKTYCVSYRPDDPGAQLADYFAPINITDRREVLAYAVENRVDAVYSVGSDFAVPVIAEVSEQLNLPRFVSCETAETCCDKIEMRKALGNSRYNLPYHICRALEEIPDDITFPLICKPADSQGQRGIFRAENLQELTECMKQSLAYSNSCRVILEPFLNGAEVSLHAFFSGGEMIFFTVTDRETFPEYPGIVRGHRIPSVYAGTLLESELRRLACETAEALGITEGPAYYQVMISDGRPYLIELSPRLDGCHLWKLLHAASGVNLMEMTVRSLFGAKTESYAKSAAEPEPYRLIFLTSPPGKPFRMPDDIDLAEKSVLYYRPGEIVHAVNGRMEKCGYQIRRMAAYIGVIGGSGIIGSVFQRMYGAEFQTKEISRTAHTISDYSEASLYDALAGCDAVVICAGPKAGAGDSMAVQYENVSITENVLRACRRRGIRNAVYLSTRCVYAAEQPVPAAEDAALSPINTYGISKAAGEMLCMLENRLHQSACKILRLAQIIAPGQNNLVSAMLECAVQDKPFPVYGQGRGGRDYIAAEDAAAAIACALRKPEVSGVFNIGMRPGEDPVSPVRMAQAAKKAFLCHSDILYMPDRPDDPTVFRMDTRKAERELGFTARYSVEEVFRLFAEKENAHDSLP